MDFEQKEWNAKTGWLDVSDKNLKEKAALVLAFGGKDAVQDSSKFDEIKSFYPNAHIVMCSTAGEILDDRVADGSINTTAMSFVSTEISVTEEKIGEVKESFMAGKNLVDSLQRPDLVYMLVISDGQITNGDELTKALGKTVRNKTVITGGLAGDGPNFQTTLVGLDQAPSSGNIVGIGFYGENLKVGHAARGGWDPFEPDRVITKAEDNILYELDGVSALDIYKKYLGELADELPGSALLFPLGVKESEDHPRLVRTVLGVDEENQSMIFAGNMPVGSRARMLRSNFDRLIDGAASAADTSISDFGSFDPDLALLISCAGRKFVLMDQVDQEVEKVREVIGNKAVIAGFYAYGEISPVVKSTKCELHNQTMTITTLKEVV